MNTRLLIASAIAIGILAGPFVQWANAESGRSHAKQVQVVKPKSGNFASNGGGNSQGGMDGWPQTLDELENAYNCGPYADKASSKKCKD